MATQNEIISSAESAVFDIVPDTIYSRKWDEVVGAFSSKRVAGMNLVYAGSTSSNLENRGNGVSPIANNIQSPNFVSGFAGWRLSSNGDLEANDGNFRGDITGASGTFTGTITATAGSIGGFNIGSDYMRDAANSFGLASTVTGGDDVRFWAGAAFASRATAPFRVTEAGAVTATNFDFTGGSVGNAVVIAIGAVNIAARGWTQTCVFSVTDADTVAWASGSFISADGTTYSIGAGNTGNMAAATYIYLDIGVSTVAYQTTTTASTAVGAGKVLLAKAQNGTTEATFETFGGIGGTNINASSIVANSITANELSTSITYAGSIIVDTSGLIRSGQTDYNTGTGWWLGNAGGTPKFSIGNGTDTKSLTWDGTDLSINGSPVSNNSIFGDGSDGDVTISVDTSLSSDKYYNNLIINTGITLNPNGFRIFIKGTLTCTGTGKIASNGNIGGNGSAGDIAGAGGSGGSAATATYTTGNLPIPLVGKSGGAGGTNGAVGSNGTAGTDQAKALGNANAVVGGTGGTGNGHAGGTGGNAGTKTGTILNIPRSIVPAFNLYDVVSGTITHFGIAPSSSGGGGGGGHAFADSGGGGGGGSGSSGGVVWVAARIIASGSIEAKGGAGGNGGNGADPSKGGIGGGGAGGNGGCILLLYSKATSLSTSASGGTGGAKGTSGADSGSLATNGSTGNSGVIITLQV